MGEIYMWGDEEGHGERERREGSGEGRKGRGQIIFEKKVNVKVFDR